MAWDESKKYIITIDHTKVDDDLDYFVHTVLLNGVDHPDFFQELDTYSKRKKVAFYAGGNQASGEKCFAEIELFDSANDKAVYHVRVPSVSQSADTVLYLYFEATEADQDTSGTSSEIDDDFTSGDLEDGWAAFLRSSGSSLVDWSLSGGKLTTTIASGTQHNAHLMRRHRVLSGNFSYQIDWELGDYEDKDMWRISLRMWGVGSDGHDDYAFVAVQRWNERRYIANYKDGGSWGSTQNSSPHSDTSGKFRIRRDGTTVYMEYYDGSWNTLKSYDFGEAYDVAVQVGVDNGVNNPKIQGKFDNLVLNSGSVSGWVDDTGEWCGWMVWDDSFMEVNHLGKDPSGGSDCMTSSTREENHGTPGGSMTSGDLVDGKVGRCLDFDGGDDYVMLDSSFSEGSNMPYFTIEALIYPDGWGEHGTYGWGRIWDKDAKIFFLSNNDSGHTGNLKLNVKFSGDDGSWWSSDDVISLSAWHYVAVVYDTQDVANDPTFHVNDTEYEDTEEQAPTGTVDDDSANDHYIGNNSAQSRSFNGKICEFRISSMQRSAAWRKATYHSLFGTLAAISTATGTALEDLGLDLGAYVEIREDLLSELIASAQIREDFLLYLEAGGIMLEDLISHLSVAASNVCKEWTGDDLCQWTDEDMPQWSPNVTYSHILLDLEASVLVLKDLDLDLAIWQEYLEDLGLELNLEGRRLEDLLLYLAAASGLILGDLPAYLAATDGSVLQSLPLHLIAGARQQEFRAVYAMSLAAIISEV